MMSNILAKWISMLPGQAPRGTADTVKKAQRDIEELQAERQAVALKLQGLSKQREAMLLGDASSVEIAKIDEECNVLAIEAERLELGQPVLVARLQELRSQAKQNHWKEIVKRYDKAAIELIATLQMALRQREALAQIRSESEGIFQAETIARLPPPPSHLNPEAVASYQKFVESLLDADLRRSLPAPPLAPAKPAPPKPREKPVQHYTKPGPKIDPGVEIWGPQPPKRIRVKITGPAAKGQVAVSFVRSGVELEGYPKAFAHGDEVFVPKWQAEQLIKNGAAIMLEPEAAPGTSKEAAVPGPENETPIETQAAE